MVNADTKAMDLEEVKECKRAQDAFDRRDGADGYRASKRSIKALKKRLYKLWQEYENFNEELFRNKVKGTTKLRTDSEALYNQQNSAVEQMKGEIAAIKAVMLAAKRYTAQQEDTFNAIEIEFDEQQGQIEESAAGLAHQPGDGGAEHRT